jgi:type 1 glutamine amidotransferase
MKRTLVVFVALLAGSLLSGLTAEQAQSLFPPARSGFMGGSEPGLLPRHKLVLIAGKPSHPPGEHEFRAGALLLQNCLAGVPGLPVNVYTNGWPADDSAFDGASAVIIYSDGGGGHPAIQGVHAMLLQALIEKGVGFGVMHYACEVPKDKGGSEFLAWVGGYYEDRYSCNPIWSPDYRAFPEHPVTRGLRPFSVRDEWYFNLRWRPDMKGITPILVAKPSDAVRDGPYVWPAGPYPNIQANKGRDEVMMWVANGPAGGRAFGFTGGHFHTNWGDGNFRKVVLNALVWVAGAEVPPGGVASTVTAEELKQNLDVKQK